MPPGFSIGLFIVFLAVAGRAFSDPSAICRFASFSRATAWLHEKSALLGKRSACGSYSRIYGDERWLADKRRTLNSVFIYPKSKLWPRLSGRPSPFVNSTMFNHLFLVPKPGRRQWPRLLRSSVLIFEPKLAEVSPLVPTNLTSHIRCLSAIGPVPKLLITLFIAQTLD